MERIDYPKEKLSPEFANWVRVVVVIFVIAPLAYWGIKKNENREGVLKLRGRLTVGETEGWVKNHRSSDYSIDYWYPFNGEVYKEFVMVNSLAGIKTTGGKYLVLFDPKNPRTSRILFDKEVDYTTLLNYKDTGWITVPDFIIMKK